MRIAILTAVWGRPRLSGMALRRIAGMKVPGVEILPIVSWSFEDANPPDLGVPGIVYVEAQNSPLSDKWNEGAKEAKRLNADALMVLGSDDFIDARLVEISAKRLKAGADYVVPQSLYFFDTETKRCIYAHADRIGAGRTISRAILDRLSYRPWVGGFDRAIDSCMDRKMMAAKVPPVFIPDIRKEGGSIVAVKSKENMWSFENMTNLKHRDVDAGEVLRSVVPEYADELLNWHE
jgi:hypothetical protein